MDRDNVERLVQHYFELALSNSQMIDVLSNTHGINISRRTLKRITRRLGLYTRKKHSDITRVAEFIAGELDTHSSMYGYRFMYLRCRQQNLNVPQKDVGSLLSILDPEGVNQRSRHRLQRRQYTNAGPNALWHIDGYDKVKPYGIAIHGCIDGYSRKIIWLRASYTNNDPKIVGTYFIDAVRELSGCPQRVRTDCGTENIYIADFQKLLRSSHDDQYAAEKSYLSGKSTTNQRIECFWGMLRRQGMQFWMNTFETLKDEGEFDGSFVDKNIMRFCFTQAIQNTLDQVKNLWNTHAIRSSPNQVVPCGKPCLLYTMPENYGGRECMKPLCERELTICEEECSRPTIHCDETIHELCTIIMEEITDTDTLSDLDSEVQGLCALYRKFRHEISELINDN